MLKTESRKEAEEWAFNDPFHTNGFRKNAVHSMNITMTENTLFMPLKKLID
jgi:phage terminase large subunit-like protein